MLRAGNFKNKKVIDNMNTIYGIWKVNKNKSELKISDGDGL